MSEKKDDGGATRGLSVVDATVADTVREETVKPEDSAKTVPDHDVREQETEDSFVEEAEEKINLFDVLQEKELEKEGKDTFQNSTLIITTEEHLDATVCDDTDLAKNSNTSTKEDLSLEDQKKVSTKSKWKNEDHSYLWVSNIDQHVKAADLKKLFSQMGKVVTAKVLTNGKNYFGYISVDSAETAGRCVKQLNNVLFDGKKIVVSKDRPDLRDTKQLAKLESRRKRLESKRESKQVEEDNETRRVEKEEARNDEIAELKKRVDKFKTEISKYKWKIVEYQRRHEGMRKKCSNMEKELKELQYKTRNDRRKLNQDRELFEKSKKIDLLRMEGDKAAVNKELCEVKKLREHLKEKIEEINARSVKKNPKRRGTRSPPTTMERSRSPRGRSPLMRGGSRIGYRSQDRSEKKRKRDDPPRGRTPPPPPKLSNGVGKKRGESLSHRQYFEDVEKRSSSSLEHHGYEYRHKPAFAPPQEVSRPPWQAPYSKDPRLVNAPPSGGHQSYPPDPRYGGGYQFPPSSIAVPPRSYYPEFGKPYGHY